jgi:ring-1,2-phenylacetyl-CoA epoxidase subunit PaaC
MPTPDAATVFGYVLGLADDVLILGHRLSEWCGHAPLLEEELALANIGLDLIGQARALYDHAGALEGEGRDQDALAGSVDATLAGIAATAQHEAAYHLRHAGDWLIRLGDGTAESHHRAQNAIDTLWPYTGEMFEGSNASLRGEWDETVDAVLAEATLARPKDGWMQTGGRSGRHSEHLGYILAELQFLQRAYPGASW